MLKKISIILVAIIALALGLLIFTKIKIDLSEREENNTKIENNQVTTETNKLSIDKIKLIYNQALSDYDIKKVNLTSADNIVFDSDCNINTEDSEEEENEICEFLALETDLNYIVDVDSYGVYSIDVWNNETYFSGKRDIEENTNESFKITSADDITSDMIKIFSTIYYND